MAPRRAEEDELIAARIGSRAEKQVDKFFQRAPFLYSMLIGLLALCIAGATWTTTLQGRVRTLEDFKWSLEHDKEIGLIEQTHQQGDAISRNQKQIRTLNQKVFGLPDPGE